MAPRYRSRRHRPRRTVGRHVRRRSDAGSPGAARVCPRPSLRPRRRAPRRPAVRGRLGATISDTVVDGDRLAPRLRARRRPAVDDATTLHVELSQPTTVKVDDPRLREQARPGPVAQDAAAARARSTCLGRPGLGDRHARPGRRLPLPPDGLRRARHLRHRPAGSRRRLTRSSRSRPGDDHGRDRPGPRRAATPAPSGRRSPRRPPTSTSRCACGRCSSAPASTSS